jgi:2-hydroxychromene-2-carboxylate isomerase
VKASLRERTEAAIALGVRGVPSVVVGGQAFWGDDRLEEAAAAI